MIQIPAFGVTGFLLTSVPELEACLSGESSITITQSKTSSPTLRIISHGQSLFGMGAIGYLINPDWAESKACPRRSSRKRTVMPLTPGGI